MKEFARLSGGEYINFTTQKGFDRSLNGLANDVHNGYLLSFQPHGDMTPGLHTITVEVPDTKDRGAAPGSRTGMGMCRWRRK